MNTKECESEKKYNSRLTTHESENQKKSFGEIFNNEMLSHEPEKFIPNSDYKRIYENFLPDSNYKPKNLDFIPDKDYRLEQGEFIPILEKKEKEGYTFKTNLFKLLEVESKMMLECILKMKSESKIKDERI